MFQDPGKRQLHPQEPPRTLQEPSHSTEEHFSRAHCEDKQRYVRRNPLTGEKCVQQFFREPAGRNHGRLLRAVGEAHEHEDRIVDSRDLERGSEGAEGADAEDVDREEDGVDN